MKLLSDEELEQAIRKLVRWGDYDGKDGDLLYPAYGISNYEELSTLINTQKRLYAAREREEGEVSGQLAAVEHLDGKIFYIETNPSGRFIKRVINNYRDELSKQYAELRRIK